MKLKNIFLKGKMNKDLDERLVPEGQYIHAENIHVLKSEGSDAGAVQNILGNKALTQSDYGPNSECIGGLADESSSKLYWLVKSDTGCYLMEYDFRQEVLTTVLEDTRSNGQNVLNLSKDKLVTGMNLIVDTDSGEPLLLWVDDYNPPRCVNIERAKTYGPNNFGQDEISLIKKPPIYSPSIEPIEDDETEENNMREKFIAFSHRYKYLDGEYSALSPFTEFSFLPGDFQFDYAQSSNEAMINSYKEVSVQFNTGSELVTDVEVVFKESGSNNVYIVETFNKEEKGWGHNETQSTIFSNNKVTKILPEDELFRLYDNVPLKAKSQEVINNRVVFGNYTENYDLVDANGQPIKVDIGLQKVVSDTERDKVIPSIKSIRDYEAGIVYLDEYGRMTTPLTSEGNTAHVSIADSTKKVWFNLNINHKPPAFAKYYRIFVKQNKQHFDNVVTTTFHKDGVYYWLKIGPNDLNKFKEGDYLIVKSDTSGVLDRYVETKVIEVRDQPKNFLEEEPVEGEIVGTKQQPGMYYKLKPVGFKLDVNDLDPYEWSAFNSLTSQAIYYESNYIEKPSYYGFQGLDDLTVSGTYTNSDEDIRYIVTIDSTDGEVDTFKWSDDGGLTFTEKVEITGGVQELSHGVQITFGNTTGHNRDDNWIIPAKGMDHEDFGSDDGDEKTYLIIKSVEGDKILGGAKIDIEVTEGGDTTKSYTDSFISSRAYDNLEEWFYGEGIDKKFEGKFHGYWFRRGDVKKGEDNRPYFYQDDQAKVNREYDPELAVLGLDDSKGDVCLIIRSSGTKNNSLDENVRMSAAFNVLQSDTNILFETKDSPINSDVYYELGRTYKIENGLHKGHQAVIDRDQTSVTPAVINLPFFNCFSWGNGFESYKIKDDYNGRAMLIDTRPLGTIKNYRQNHRKASLTYSGVYEQSTSYNALNEFNLSLANYKDLDDSYGSIQKLYSRDTNLLVLQENKASQVLVGKSVLYNADGSSNIQKSTSVLGDAITYSGEFGISTNPESFVSYGTLLTWTDARRGKVIKLGGRGLFPVSNWGMNSWFRDYFSDNPDVKAVAGYDPYLDKMVLHVPSYTLTFDEAVEGWTSFFSFQPDWMLRLGNRFFTLKEGQLYLHNDDSVPRNNFYGVQYDTKLSFTANQLPSDIKVFKAIGIEGNQTWETFIKAFKSDSGDFYESTVKGSEYVRKEGYLYAHIRRNELTTDFSSKANYGIGIVQSALAYNITLFDPNSNIVAGDVIYTESGTEIGVVKSTDGTRITFDTTVPPITGEFIYGVKDSRIEGAEMRGYGAVIELENSSSDKLELYAVNTEVTKSHR